VKQELIRTAPAWSRRRIRDNDRIHDGDRYFYPTQYVNEGMTFLWYPWTVCMLRALSEDDTLTDEERTAAAEVAGTLLARVSEFGAFSQSEYSYVAAEALITVGWPHRSETRAPRLAQGRNLR
jgi:hypothetical protein